MRVLEQGVENGIGEVSESRFKTALPYTVSFKSRLTKLDRPTLIQLEAVGELTGIGRYDILQNGDQTQITYTWEVRTTKMWMNVMAPLLKPVFVWNHHKVMHLGAIALAKRLNATLIRG